MNITFYEIDKRLDFNWEKVAILQTNQNIPRMNKFVSVEKGIASLVFFL